MFVSYIYIYFNTVLNKRLHLWEVDVNSRCKYLFGWLVGFNGLNLIVCALRVQKGHVMDQSVDPGWRRNNNKKE